MDMNDIVLQDDPMCNLKGRDCIEKAVGEDFNCSLSCEGMYADVQWLGAPGGEEGTIEREWMRLNGRMDKEKEELNKKKILALVNEYNVFKRENVRHFMFDAEETEESFGEIQLPNHQLGCI